MKRFCEFFAGVGLVREGLKSSEWNCVFSNDISSDKEDLYIRNFGGDHFLRGDIWDLAKNHEVVPNNSFLYTASFPCTDLSVAGARAGLKGEESGTLAALLSIIKDKKKISKAPKVVLLENVKGFLTSNGGNDVIDTVKEFSDLNYFIDIIEIDAIDFSPQSRPRVFLIAVDESIAKEKMQILNLNQNQSLSDSFFRSKSILSIIERSKHLNWAFFELNPPKKTNKRLKDIIEKNISDQSEKWWSELRKNHLFSQMSESHKEKLNDMIKLKKISYASVYRRTRNGKPMAELRTDGYAGCLRTPRGGSSKQILIAAGNGSWKVRFLTSREYARLQGVRDSFILPENDNKGYFAMGDAVCVPVIEYISKNILDFLFENNQTEFKFI